VFVDNSTTPVTFWVGNNHGASIVKLEPLNETDVLYRSSTTFQVGGSGSR
jgi:hypothetical protein